MNGRAMSAGLQGFFMGFDQGQKLVGADPVSRELDMKRAALKDERESGVMKALLEAQRWQAEQQAKADDRVYNRAKDAWEQEHTLQRDAANDNFRNQEFQSNNAYRGLLGQQLEGQLAEQKRSEEFRNRAASMSELWGKFRTGEVMTPDEYQRIKQFGMLASNPRLADADTALVRAAQEFPTKGAGAFRNPQLVQILSDTFAGPLNQTVGSALNDKEKVGAVSMTDMVPNEDGSLSFKLKVQPVGADGKPTRDAYTTWLTEGRTPIGEADTATAPSAAARFSPQMVAQTIRGVRTLAGLRTADPEMATEMDMMLESMRAAKTPEEGQKLYLERRDKQARERAKVAAKDGGTKDLRSQFDSILQASELRDPSAMARMLGGDDAPPDRIAAFTQDETERRGRMRQLGYDYIAQHPDATLDEVMSVVQQQVPAPASVGLKDAFRPTDAQRPKDEVTSVGGTGNPVATFYKSPDAVAIAEAYRKKEITLEEAKQRLAELRLRQ